MPFKAGINTATYKYYIDFAKQFGLQRIMMDAGWSNYKNLFEMNPEINMDTLAAYAKSKGIKIKYVDIVFHTWISNWTVHWINSTNGALILS